MACLSYIRYHGVLLSNDVTVDCLSVGMWFGTSSALRGVLSYLHQKVSACRRLDLLGCGWILVANVPVPFIDRIHWEQNVEILFFLARMY